MVFPTINASSCLALRLQLGTVAFLRHFCGFQNINAQPAARISYRPDAAKRYTPSTIGGRAATLTSGFDYFQHGVSCWCSIVITALKWTVSS